MATFDYSGALPQFKALISSSQLRGRYNDLKTHLNTNNPSGIVFPDTSAGSEHQAILLDSTKIAPTLSFVFRSNVDLENDQGAGTANQAFISDGDGTTNYSFVFRSNTDLNHTDGQGTAGQVLQSDGDGTTSWLDITVQSAYAVRNSAFGATDNGRFVCDTSGGAFNCTIFATTSVDDEFLITPSNNADFETNAVTVVRVGSEEIAGVAENFICDVNAEYHFRGNTSGNWTVTVRPVLRST